MNWRLGNDTGAQENYLAIDFRQKFSHSFQSDREMDANYVVHYALFTK